jgi:hypothetical protein
MRKREREREEEEDQANFKKEREKKIIEKKVKKFLKNKTISLFLSVLYYG